MANLKPGDYVRHSACPEWGLGQIADIRGSIAVIHFEQSDRPREFRIPHPMLVAAPEGATSPPKVNLMRRFGASAKSARARKATAKSPMQTFEAVMEQFLKTHPTGFADRAWLDARRSLERVASRAQLVLEAGSWGKKIESASFEEIGRAFRDVVQTESFIHPAQALRVAAIRDGAFWQALKQWAWRETEGHDVLDTVVAGLVAAEQASWPNATVLRGVLAPATDIFVRPDSFKRTAAVMAIDLPYEAKPSAAGYAELLRFVDGVKKRLESAGQKPADYWDVTTFCRFVAGSRTSGSDARAEKSANGTDGDAAPSNEDVAAANASE